MILRVLKYAGRTLIAEAGTADDVRLCCVAFNTPAHALLAACIMATVNLVTSRDCTELWDIFSIKA